LNEWENIGGGSFRIFFLKNSKLKNFPKLGVFEHQQPPEYAPDEEMVIRTIASGLV